MDLVVLFAEETKTVLSQTMALEALASTSRDGSSYPFGLVTSGEPWTLDPAPMWSALLTDVVDGVSPATIAARFHRGLAAAFCTTALRIAENHGAAAIALGGGVFQNGLLLDICLGLLAEASLPVLTPAQVPANDGGLAYGQAIIAAAQALIYSVFERSGCRFA